MSDTDLSDEEILNLCIVEEKEADQLESLIPKIETEMERNERVLINKVIAEENKCTREYMAVLTNLAFEERNELDIFKEEIKRNKKLVSFLKKLIR